MDTHTIKQSNDLLALAERAGAKFHKAGKGFSSHCPIHGGDNPNAFSVYVGDDGYQHFKCFTRSECNRHGSNVIAFVMALENCDFKKACELLGSDASSMGISPRHTEPPAPLTYEPPADIWQARAMQLIDRAQAALWDTRGSKALAWLHARGLHDETIRAARLGYIPQSFSEKPETWGTPNDNPEPLYIHKGILIPGIMAGKVWYLKIRIHNPSDPKDKYKGVRGNKTASLYFADFITANRAAVFCEGEFDALLLSQEVKDLTSVITLGSATNKLNLATWGIYLLRPSSFLIAYDTDEAGKHGGDDLSWLHDSRRLQVPILRAGDKDLTDFHKSGGNLYSLIESAIRPEAPIFVNWRSDVKPVTIQGQYWQNPDNRIEAFYQPDELAQCLQTMQTIA